MKLVIDIGSNTSKCLLAEKTSSGLNKLFELSLENRISAGSGKLVDNASDMIANAIKKFIFEAKKFSASFTITAVATSALREAIEGKDVAKKASATCGVDVKILSGEEEAKYAYLGAMSDSSIPYCNHNAFFDLGGGSLEIVFGAANVQNIFSLPIGAVVLTKTFCKDEVISSQAKKEIEVFLENQIAKIDSPEPEILVGAGGAVVAARLMNEKINGKQSNKITIAEIERFIEILLPMSVETRAERFGIARNRADIIVPAFLCITALAKRLNKAEIFHTFHNLRYGLILND